VSLLSALAVAAVGLGTLVSTGLIGAADAGAETQEMYMVRSPEMLREHGAGPANAR